MDTDLNRSERREQSSELRTTKYTKYTKLILDSLSASNGERAGERCRCRQITFSCGSCISWFNIPHRTETAGNQIQPRMNTDGHGFEQKRTEETKLGTANHEIHQIHETDAGRSLFRVVRVFRGLIFPTGLKPQGTKFNHG